MSLPKLIVILGPNASGKTSLSIELAKKYNGEIVSADSRQIYQGLDLGTGKVKKKEAKGIPHYMIDILKPLKPFSVAAFQQQALLIIKDIIKRGKTPFLVGGTGLYIKAVVEGYQFSSLKIDKSLRAKLETKSVEELSNMLKQRVRMESIKIDVKNKRRLIRAIEKIEAGIGLEDQELNPQFDVLELGILWPKETLHERIEQRLSARLKEGLIKEVEDLLNKGINRKFLYDLGLEYRYTLWYIEGKFASFQSFYDELYQAIKKFAKRQMTWFKKNKKIIWLDPNKNIIKEASFEIDCFLRK